MVTTHRTETYQNSLLAESTEVTESPPSAFTFTRRDPLGTILEQRAATPLEIEGLVVRQDRAARRAAEQAVKNINVPNLTSIPALRDAVATLRDLMLRAGLVADN